MNQLYVFKWQKETQWGRELAAKPDDLELNPSSPNDLKKKWTLKCCLLKSKYTHYGMYVLPHTKSGWFF